MNEPCDDEQGRGEVQRNWMFGGVADGGERGEHQGEQGRGGGGRGGGDELGFLTLYAAGSIEHIAADVFENVEGAG